MVAIPNIEEFKARLINGGARPTMFSVSCTFPNTEGNASGKNELTYLSYMAKAASIPADTIGQIPVGFFGRKVQLAGDRSYSNWGVSIINSEDFIVRRAFEDWHFHLNAPVANVRNPALLALRNYKTDVTVTQLGQDGRELRSYRMIGAFPAQIGEITLSWDVQNTIEEFDVVFAYDYFVPLDSSGASYAGRNVLDTFSRNGGDSDVPLTGVVPTGGQVLL